MHLETLWTHDLGRRVELMRAIPTALGAGRRGLLLVHQQDFDVDPYHRMFFFPTGTIHLTMLDDCGRRLWERDLGRGVVPGLWFCPVLAFDLDGDGCDEVWFVGNADPEHPLDHQSYTLERLAGLSGETLGSMPWPDVDPQQSMSHCFRNMLAGAQVDGQPVLITAQGTYRDRQLQGWNADLTPRWQRVFRGDEPGGLGSHMHPIADLDGSGPCIHYGEAAVDIADGSLRFYADRDCYRGHSDIIAPVRDRRDGSWSLFICRESDGNTAPRIASFDAQGQRRWGDLDQGHIDIGWAAHLAGYDEPICHGIRISGKTCGPRGRFHNDLEEFVYGAVSGEPIDFPFPLYHCGPVDLDGDGYHELVTGARDHDGSVVLDAKGVVMASFDGNCCLRSHFLDLPGEQLLAYSKDGRVSAICDRDARDSDIARERYAHPFYQTNQKLTGSGAHGNVLAGL